MIVNPLPTGWEIIYHRAHALLAAQIGGQWRRKDAPPRLYETIATISHHDDLEREWEEYNLTEAGTPMDFMMSDGEPDYEKLRHHIEGGLYRGRWVALLTSIHLCRLTHEGGDNSAKAEAFLSEQLEKQKVWRDQLGISKDEVVDAYAFLNWCDRLSLILCQRKIPDDHRAIEISKAHDGQRYDLKERMDGTLTVIPWCFQDDQFTVNVEASELTEVKFDDNASLTKALEQAPRKLLEWTFVKEDEG